MPQLTIDRAILEALRQRAESAARLVGHIDLADCVLAPLEEDINVIVHELNELLGNPHLIALERLEHRFDQKLMTGLETWGNMLLARIDALEQRVLTELAVLSERLSKLLGNPGNPYLIAAPVQSAHSTLELDAGPEHVEPGASAASRTISIAIAIRGAS